MTTFQTLMLDWFGGVPAMINGLWYSPEEVMRSPRLAERLYWAVLT